MQGIVEKANAQLRKRIKNNTMIHLICGPSGAGKSTHALKIAKERKAVPLFLDECLKQHISFPDVPNESFIRTELVPKMKECGSKIIHRCEEVLKSGSEVVL